MNMQRFLPALLATLLAAPAWAQSTDKPLNLKLPPSDLPAASRTAATPARAAPGVYYGDTSGSLGTDISDTTDTGDCDDSSYNQAQVHGSVSTGVMTGSHIGTGTWNSGEIHVSKAFGSCDDPSGGINFSVGTSEGHFHGDRRGRDH